VNRSALCRSRSTGQKLIDEMAGQPVRRTVSSSADQGGGLAPSAGGGGVSGVRRTFPARSELPASAREGSAGPALATDREPCSRHNKALKLSACKAGEGPPGSVVEGQLPCPGPGRSLAPRRYPAV
jgi:hypothetical protein